MAPKKLTLSEEQKILQARRIEAYNERKKNGVSLPMCQEIAVRTGKPCANVSVAGSDPPRCSRHGGAQTKEERAATLQGQIVHHENNMDAIISGLVEDPELLSPHKIAALSKFLVDYGRIAALLGLDDTLDRVSKVHSMVYRHTRIIEGARKMVRQSEILISAAMPVFSEVGQWLTEILREHLTPALADQVMTQFDRRLTDWIDTLEVETDGPRSELDNVMDADEIARDHTTTALARLGRNQKEGGIGGIALPAIDDDEDGDDSPKRKTRKKGRG